MGDLLGFGHMRKDKGEKNMKVKNAIEPPTNERLEYLEKAYRIKWPAKFKEFLKFANGGIPQSNVLPDSRERVIERFLCITESPKFAKPPAGEYDISVVVTQLDERIVDDEDTLGIKIIPFAALFAGDFLCLDYREKENPTVVVWDHEQSDELKPYVEEVFSSFDDFVKKML